MARRSPDRSAQDRGGWLLVAVLPLAALPERFPDRIVFGMAARYNPRQCSAVCEPNQVDGKCYRYPPLYA
jgi:hypothetical protein